VVDKSRHGLRSPALGQLTSEESTRVLPPGASLVVDNGFVSMFRPAARVSAPDGREWEIYAYRLQMPTRGTPDPYVGSLPGYRAEAVISLLDGVVYVLAWIPRLLLRFCVDLPIAAARSLKSDEWTIEAISWTPFRTNYKWSTTREFRGNVLAQVEGGLARGETPHPRNAVLLGVDT